MPGRGPGEPRGSLLCGVCPAFPPAVGSTLGPVSGAAAGKHTRFCCGVALRGGRSLGQSTLDRDDLSRSPPKSRLLHLQITALLTRVFSGVFTFAAFSLTFLCFSPIWLAFGCRLSRLLITVFITVLLTSSSPTTRSSPFGFHDMPLVPLATRNAHTQPTGFQLRSRSPSLGSRRSRQRTARRLHAVRGSCWNSPPGPAPTAAVTSQHTRRG